MSDDTIILRPFRQEDADWLSGRHGALYAESDGFDATFETSVAGILADFIADHDPIRERGWIAQRGDDRLGSIFCVDNGGGVAKLRLFLVDHEARGQGLGRRLLKTCIEFARDCGYREMMLWTHESHKVACAIYASHGFRLLQSKPVQAFGVDLIEQTWALDLKSAR